MKRILGYISLVGVLGATGWLIFSLITNSGQIFPTIKPVPANLFKLEDSGFAKFFYPNMEDSSHTKLEFPKVESEDPSPLNQPPAPPPPESPTPTSEPEEESESLSSPNCDPFDGMKLSLVTLSIREDIMVLPLYLKTEGDVIPGLDPLDDTLPSEFHALLRYVKSNSCGLQGGFEDRLYCMFSVTPDMPGSVADFFLYLDDCEDPVFTQLNLSIPELRPPLCNEDLGKDDCVAAGGIMSNDASGAPYCDCP